MVLIQLFHRMRGSLAIYFAPGHLCIAYFLNLLFSWCGLRFRVKKFREVHWAVESKASEVQRVLINFRAPDAAHAAFADFSDVASTSLTAGAAVCKLEHVVSAHLVLTWDARRLVI